MTMSGKGAALVTALLLGGIGDVVAQDRGATTLEPMRIMAEAAAPGFMLENGSSPSRMFSNVDQYHFDVNDARSLRVVSEQWSAEGTTRQLHATLRDRQGRAVAHSRSNGGEFVLERQLAPGSYTLEVRSSLIHGGWNRGSQHYRVVTGGLQDRVLTGGLQDQPIAHQRHDGESRQEMGI